jgi:pyruvate kinase
VYPILEKDPPEDWRRYARDWLRSNGISGDLVLLIEGPSSRNPTSNHRLEIIEME